MTDLSTHPHTDQDPVLDTCPTCQHPLSAHDRIGLRWCAATKLGVGQRDCVCSAAAGNQAAAGASWAQIRHGSAAR
ncbi:MAG TPA: RGCVC family protein [Microlunatus sp.]